LSAVSQAVSNRFKDTEAAELADVWRFANLWERDASLALRRGDLSTIDGYDDHTRLTAGTSDQMEDASSLATMAAAEKPGWYRWMQAGDRICR
jgi:hypothetical protein